MSIKTGFVKLHLRIPLLPMGDREVFWWRNLNSSLVRRRE
jgi:hypothetical protein